MGTAKAFNLIVSKQGLQKAEGKGKSIKGKKGYWGIKANRQDSSHKFITF
ncbi:MAG: hypothetical protein AB8A37_06720 [Prochlorococcus sp.]